GLVLEGRARPELLDSYEAERRPIAEQVIWAASSLHEIFMGHGKDIAERAQRINDQSFLEAVVGRCSGISYTYRDYAAPPAGLAGPPGPARGGRAPGAARPGGPDALGRQRSPGRPSAAPPSVSRRVPPRTRSSARTPSTGATASPTPCGSICSGRTGTSGSAARSASPPSSSPTSRASSSAERSRRRPAAARPRCRKEPFILPRILTLSAGGGTYGLRVLLGPLSRPGDACA